MCKKKWGRRPSSRRECFMNPFSIVANVLFLPKRLARDSHNKIFFRIIPAFFCLAHSALTVATNLITHSGFASNCYLNHWARECLYNLWDSCSSEVDEQVAADAMMSHLLRSLTHLLLHSKGPKAVV